MRSNSCAFATRAATFVGFLSAPCLRSSAAGATCASFATSKLKNARRYRGQLLRTLAQLRPACRMQRDRTSKYSWSVRGFLPGRQRLRCSFANVHSQGARWLIRSSGIERRETTPLRHLTDRALSCRPPEKLAGPTDGRPACRPSRPGNRRLETPAGPGAAAGQLQCIVRRRATVCEVQELP